MYIWWTSFFTPIIFSNNDVQQSEFVSPLFYLHTKAKKVTLNFGIHRFLSYNSLDFKKMPTQDAIRFCNPF